MWTIRHGRITSPQFVSVTKYCDERPVTQSLNLGMCSPDTTVEGFNVSMSDNIYKKIELVGSSPNGVEDAVNNAISRAGKTIRNMNWFEVAEVRGQIEDNKVAHWQVTVKVGFTLDS
jgi:dodecin